MAAHSSILARRIPETEERGGLLSMGSHRVGHDGSDLAAAAAYASLLLHIHELIKNDNINFYPQGIFFFKDVLLSSVYFTYGNVSFHVTLSIHLTRSSPLPMSISVLYVCFSIAAL